MVLFLEVYNFYLYFLLIFFIDKGFPFLLMKIGIYNYSTITHNCKEEEYD